jgi:hypothetical protein
MNRKLIYFILFLVIASNFKSVENLEVDIDTLMANKMNSIQNKIGSNEINDSNPALQDGYNENINDIVSNKIQKALGNNNTVNIISEEGTFENKVIENEPVVTSNNEIGGGISDIMIIILLLFIVFFLINK